MVVIRTHASVTKPDEVGCYKCGVAPSKASSIYDPTTVVAQNRWLNRVIQLELEGNPAAEQLGPVSLSEGCRMYCSLAPSVYTCLCYSDGCIVSCPYACVRPSLKYYEVLFYRV